MGTNRKSNRAESNKGESNMKYYHLAWELFFVFLLIVLCIDSDIRADERDLLDATIEWVSSLAENKNV